MYTKDIQESQHEKIREVLVKMILGSWLSQFTERVCGCLQIQDRPKSNQIPYKLAICGGKQWIVGCQNLRLALFSDWGRCPTWMMIARRKWRRSMATISPKWLTHSDRCIIDLLPLTSSGATMTNHPSNWYLQRKGLVLVIVSDWRAIVLPHYLTYGPMDTYGNFVLTLCICSTNWCH